MAKSYGKLNILVILLTSAILALLGVFCISATFAADDWLRVEQPYTALASTDTLHAELTTDSSITVTHTQGTGNGHFTEFDIVAFESGAKPYVKKSISLKEADGTFGGTLIVGFEGGSFDYAYAFPSKAEITTVAEDGTTTTKEISYGNEYVSDFFELQSINNESHLSPTDPIAVNGGLKSVYIIGDIVVDKPLTFTRPCTLNLLRSTVTLKSNLTLRHNYGGIYGIDTVYDSASVAVGTIRQEGGALSAVTPNAYFGIASGAVTGDAPSVTCSIEGINGADNAVAVTELVNGMLTAAQDYLTNSVPTRLTHNITLPSAYAASGVTYAYAVTTGGEYLTADGVIDRQDESQIATLSVTATYNGIYSSSANAAARSFELSLTVVGRGAKAAQSELLAIVGGTVETGMTAADGKYAPNGAVDLTEALGSFRTLGFTDTVTLSVSDPSGSSLYVGGAQASSVTVAPQSSADSVRLVFASRLINGGALTLTASSGGETSSVPYTLVGMAESDVTDYLETLIYTPEFAARDAEYGFVDVFGGELYRGTDRVENSLGISSAEIKAVSLTERELTELESAADSSAYIAGKWAEWSTSEREFTVTRLSGDGALTGGTVKANTLSQGRKYVVAQKFVIDTDLSTAEAEVEYYAYRTALVPEAGIGGSDTTQYIAGNTFADFYETLDNGRLLESGGYAFAVDTTGISIYAVIEGEDVSEYCYFAYKDPDGAYVKLDVNSDASYAADEYFIYVDISKFPEYDAAVKATIYFYYAQQTDNFKAYAIGGFIDDPDDPNYNATAAASCFTTQSYSFTLPGIYRVTTASMPDQAFASELIYNVILNAKTSDGTAYIYDAYRRHAAEDGSYTFSGNNYLYADGAAAVNKTLSFASLAGSSLDPKGIELLTGTSGFVFDGVTVTNLSGAFADVNTHITSLSFVGCGLSDGILGAYLANCRGLTTVDLSSNSITSVNGLLYRTVTELSLASNSLTDIAGINGLPNLVKLDLSGNAVKYFGELIELTKLKEVNVSNNTVTDNIALGAGVAYGTTGEVNIPVYVFLLNVREAVIKGNNGNIVVGSGENDITIEHQLASLILTGVEYDRIVSSATFSKSVEWGGNYTVESVMTVNESFSEYTPSNGDDFYFVVSVTYGGTTCYALYSATLSGGAQ